MRQLRTLALLLLATSAAWAQVTVTGTVKLNKAVDIAPASSPAPVLVSILVTPVTSTVTIGATVNYTATGTFNDASTSDVTSSCTWTSTAPSVATIGGAANPQPVTTIAAGTSNITCTIGAVSNFGILTAILFNIVPASLPNGFTSVVYSQTISTVNGISPITMSVTAGSPPTGVTCTPTGDTLVCSGTPSVADTYTFTVHAVDSTPGTPLTDDQVYTISIGPPPASAAQLPQNWVDPHQCDTARSAPNTTFTIPGTYTATAAGVIQAFTDADAFRIAHPGAGKVKIVIAHGTSIQGGGAGFTMHGTTYAGTDCVWVTSDTPLRRGVQFGSVAISTISRNAGTGKVTVVTLDPHQLSNGMLATISNVTGGTTNFNVYQDGGGVAVTVVNATTFTYPQAGPSESGTVTFPYTIVTGANGITSQTGNLYKFVQGVSNSPIINSDQKAHHWVFEDMEATLLSTVQQDTGVIVFGTTSGGTLSTQAFHIGLEQVYYHGCTGAGVPTTTPIFPQPDTGCGNETKTKNLNRMLCGDCWVINSFGDQAVYNGIDSHVTGSFAGQGPMLFANNHFRGGSTTWHFGGSPEPIPLLLVTDVESRMNIIDRDPNWRLVSGCGVAAGVNRHWNLKNNWEMKMMNRAIVSGNLIENNWCDGQAGDQGLLTVRGDEYWFRVNDVTLEDNVMAHAYGPFEVLGRDQSVGSGAGFSMTLQRVNVRNNVWYGLGDGTFALTNGSVRVIPQGTGQQNYTCTATRTGTTTVTLTACSCPIANCGNAGSNKTGVTAGDWLNVNSCTDPTMNTATGPNVTHTTASTSDPFTAGPVVYPSPGVNGAGTCTLTNSLGWPNAMAWDANTFVLVGPGAGTNSPLVLNTFTGNFPRNLKVTNTMFVRSSGNNFFLYTGNNLDGSKSTRGAAGFDQAGLEFHHIAQSGGQTVTAGNQSEWNPVGVEIAPANLNLNVPAACGGPGPNPASPTCLGMVGDMSSFSAPLNGDFHQYKLKSNSYFAAGNPGQSSASADLGANFTEIDNARITNIYVCSTDCTQGGTVHGPYAIN